MANMGKSSSESETESNKISDLQFTEETWYTKIYQGDSVPQLTLRALVMGSLLGAFMSLSNLYVGLKTGWGLGVAITACILSFAIYKTLNLLFPGFFKTEMTVLENNCMQSTASSAGYSTGGAISSAIAAYLIVTGNHIPMGVLLMWTFFLAALGVFMAIPMKRQMINREALRFPSGIAAAETLKSLHSTGKEAMLKAKSLGGAAVFGGALAWVREVGKPFSIPGQLNFPGTIAGQVLSKWTISFEMSTIMIAAGAIIGWKISWSLMLGAIINYTYLAPKMVELGAIDATKLGYRAIMGWSTWCGAAIMVSSGLVTFLFQWKTIVRALSGFTALFNKSKNNTKEEDVIAQIEVPTSWFLTGTLLSGMGCIWVLYTYFGTTISMGIVAVVLTFFLALVACRATGESDITPIGAMGKITQLLFGVLAPSNIVTNLMTASVTAGAASSSADLLTDLKSGYLLGANPRKQFIAQFIGIFIGTIVVVPAFYMLIPTAADLGTDRWPAPSAQVWATVAKLLAKGFEALHPMARMGLIGGLILGAVISVIEQYCPEKIKRFIPSATGLGLALVIPFFNSLAMFIGAVISLILEKKKPIFAEKYIVPVSSGFIAGESLIGIVIALGQAGGWF